MRVIADRNIELVADIQALEVLPHHHEIEIAFQRGQLVNRELVQFQIVQAVLVFQIFLVIQRGTVDVHRYYLGLAIREGINRRLVGAASRNENVQIGLVLLVGPQDLMGVRRVEPIPIHPL